MLLSGSLLLLLLLLLLKSFALFGFFLKSEFFSSSHYSRIDKSARALLTLASLVRHSSPIVCIQIELAREIETRINRNCAKKLEL
jgi:hypothetical protein